MPVSFKCKNQNTLIINKVLLKLKMNGGRSDSGMSL